MSYFAERMAQMGVTAENNKVTLDDNADPEALQNGKQALYTAPIFTETPDGDIEILLYTLHRKCYKYPEKGVQGAENRTRYDVITRYTPERAKEKDKKYHITGKTGVHPWFHPFFLDAFEKKQEIPVMAITEGAFKGWMATENGIPTVALSSITHYKDKTTQTIHPEIIELIKACQVKAVVILWDGDCLDVSSKALSDGEDLYKRPAQFFNAVRTMQQLLKEFVNVKQTALYFAHINTKELYTQPKGLDDLLISHPGKIEAIKADFIDFEKPPTYFKRKNISTSCHDLQKYFRINSAQAFWDAHNEIIKDKAFIFNGSSYKHDGHELRLIKPAIAKDYFRVGDQYYHKYVVPNKWGQNEKVFSRLNKDTIQSDHGKAFLEHIDRHNAFCVVPNHLDFEPVINNCYNAYSPFEHLPAEGECPVTLDYIKHIFQEQYEMGLDYVQLLYQRPQQQLPIVCLVSKEQKTGKTTFIRWLKSIFTSNVAIVGNSELSDSFNAAWAPKLLVCCDESFIEKNTVVEKIKAMCTADRIFMNAKGRDHVEIDFFAKFILLSNKEESFIYAGATDTRYWVRKVPVIKEERPILEEMIREIPAFLHMLSTRQMHTPYTGTRLYFSPDQIATDALKKVVENNEPAVVKEIRARMQDLFAESAADTILMTTKNLHSEFFNRRVELNYIRRMVIDNLGIDYYRDPAGKSVVKKYSWPKHMGSFEGEEAGIKWIKDCGRPFVFKKEDFLHEEVAYEALAMPFNQVPPAPPADPAETQLSIPEDDTLPF